MVYSKVYKYEKTWRVYSIWVLEEYDNLIDKAKHPNRMRHPHAHPKDCFVGQDNHHYL
jgi:hypothetical protein